MRPLRFLLTLATCLIAFLVLVYTRSGTMHSSADPTSFSTRNDASNSLSAFFTWRAPSSLFPPSAIISLTDDNSTFFLARPAAFGPVLPARSLSGQLWVGSGFGDDHLRGVVGGGVGAEGELGCSDIPDWEVDGSYNGGSSGRMDGKGFVPDTIEDEMNGKKARRSFATDAQGRVVELDTSIDIVDEDDGTDDHLHTNPLSPSTPNTQKQPHADIQSLQEAAEITGKVVLLSRGGCGFLEKTKWVQRRGGVALIVGDDIRGGPLVTMYARGDTRNVSIPSVFTSHMTAHLLATLIPVGGVWEDGEGGMQGQVGSGKVGSGEKASFTTTSAAAGGRATVAARAGKKGRKVGQEAEHEERKQEEEDGEPGWFRSLFGSRSPPKDSRRPPSSGNIGWVQEEFINDDDEDDTVGVIGKDAISSTTSSAVAAKKTAAKKAGSSSRSRKGEDDFVIGVQDWRDPDMVAEQKASSASTSSSSSTRSVQAAAKSTGLLRGGSITPGSGEYGKPPHEAVDLATWSEHAGKEGKGSEDGVLRHDEQEETEEQKGWFRWMFKPHHRHEDAKNEESHGKNRKKPKANSKLPSTPKSSQPLRPTNHNPAAAADLLFPPSLNRHQGLWVTLTPTTMSSSPFFDTLLVLVVSPLVTLTVVYALLLLRSRIRRRRWRAPKSVVERLPVRTYQTMSTPTPTSPSASASASAVGGIGSEETTPLLPPSSSSPSQGPSQARPIARPRSRTASEIPVQAGGWSSLRSDRMASPSLEAVEEKRAAGLAEWRKRYGGKQRECVVCLEEYVDGVSRVMSLPCGHEFHVECMYVAQYSLSFSWCGSTIC